MTEDVRKAIEKVNIKEGEGFRRGDAAAVAALYTEDAVLLPPNSEMIRGRQKIEEFWSTAMQMGVKDVVLTTVELSKVCGDTVHEMGNYTLKIHLKGKKPIEDKREIHRHLETYSRWLEAAQGHLEQQSAATTMNSIRKMRALSS